MRCILRQILNLLFDTSTTCNLESIFTTASRLLNPYLLLKARPPQIPHKGSHSAICCTTIGGSRGRRWRAPQRDPILSFSHTFLPKSTHVRGWHSPNGLAPPQREILDPPLTTFYFCYARHLNRLKNNM